MVLFLAVTPLWAEAAKTSLSKFSNAFALASSPSKAGRAPRRNGSRAGASSRKGAHAFARGVLEASTRAMADELGLAEGRARGLGALAEAEPK